MAENKGWVKSHRSIMDNWVYEDAKTYKAFMHLCMTVNVKSNTTNFDGNLCTIHPGQRITSVDKLSKELKFTWRITDKILKMLADDDMIQIKKIGKGIIVTVVNFGKYQSLSQSRDDSRDDSREHSRDDSRKDSRNDSRQYKKDKNDIDSYPENDKRNQEAAKRTGFVWGEDE